MHDIPNVQIENPVVLVFEAKDIPHIQLEPMVEFEEVDISIVMEGYLHLLVPIFLASEHMISFGFFESVD